MNEFDFKEENKKSSNIILIIIIVIMILIIGGLVFYIVTSNKTTTSNTNNLDNNTTINTNKKKSLATDNEQIISLFNSAHSSHGCFSDDSIFKTDGLKVSEMTDEYKFGIMGSSIHNVGMSVDEKTVKNAYEKVFGPGTYKTIDSFELGCAPYTYEATNKNYNTTIDGCGVGSTPIGFYEEIVFAYKYSDKIEIISAVVYPNGEDSSLYKDYNATQKISEYDSTIFNAKSYLTENYANLTNYTYTYKLNDDGFYYLDSIIKTN